MPDTVWTRWRSLSPLERRATIAAAALIPIVHLSVKTLGADRTQRFFATRPVLPTGDDTTAQHIAQAVSRAARRGVVGGSCLSRSIALVHLLGRNGISAEVRFGARIEESRLDAHAWVEHEGVPLNESPGIARRFPIFR